MEAKRKFHMFMDNLMDLDDQDKGSILSPLPPVPPSDDSNTFGCVPEILIHLYQQPYHYPVSEFDPEVFEMVLGATGSFPSTSFLDSFKSKRKRARAASSHFKYIAFSGKLKMSGIQPVTRRLSRNSVKRIPNFAYAEDLTSSEDDTDSREEDGEDTDDSFIDDAPLPPDNPETSLDKEFLEWYTQWINNHPSPSNHTEDTNVTTNDGSNKKLADIELYEKVMEIIRHEKLHLSEIEWKELYELATKCTLYQQPAKKDVLDSKLHNICANGFPYQL